MRDLLPLRRLLAEITANQNLTTDGNLSESVIRSKVFEDNNGALTMATAPKMTPRSKHIAVKYHFFKSHIGSDKGIVIKKIDSESQLADIFTKGLERVKFENIRKLLMNW